MVGATEYQDSITLNDNPKYLVLGSIAISALGVGTMVKGVLSGSLETVAAGGVLTTIFLEETYRNYNHYKLDKELEDHDYPYTIPL